LFMLGAFYPKRNIIIALLFYARSCAWQLAIKSHVSFNEVTENKLSCKK